jgi:hypothetical protein
VTDPDRDTLAHVYRDYEAAVKAARALWPGTTEATMREAAADFLIHLRECKRQTVPPVAPASTDGGMARGCPVCRGPMRDQRATKRGNQPDFKCASRSCDGALWLDHKEKR